MSSLAPPPASPSMSAEFGPVPNAGVAGPISPMPGQMDPNAMMDDADVAEINNRLKAIANRHPAAVPAIQQINDGLMQMQMAMLGSQPPMQPVAPPL